MDVNDIRNRMAALMEKATAIEAEWAKAEEPMPQEAQDELAGYLGKVDEYKAQLGLLERAKSHSEFMNDPANQPVTQTAWRSAAPGEGEEEIDAKAWREVDVSYWRVDPMTSLAVKDTSTIRFHVPIGVQAKGYEGAFEAYLRFGKDGMGPQDRKTLTEGTDSAGGFLVPEDYQTELIKKIATMATIRARARVATTGRDMAKWPKVHYTTDNKYTSGVRLTWTGESPSTSTAHRVTDPVFGLYSIPVHTAMASMPVSNDLVEDNAFDIMGISSDLLAEAFTLDENNAFLNGSGIGRPMGILTQVDGDGPSSTNSGTASTLTADGLIDLAYAQPAQYEAGSIWLMNKATEKVIRKLKDANNDYLWPVWPQQGNFAPAPRDLLGFPVMRDEFVPDIAAGAYPIIFGDLRGYLILDRVGLSIQRLTDSAYSELNLTGLLARKRVGGQVIEPWRIQVQKVSA
ncbi:MAG: phage major capsid protein [bacterium]